MPCRDLAAARFSTTADTIRARLVHLRYVTRRFVQAIFYKTALY